MSTRPTTRRERLDRATKNAKRRWPALTWKQARARGRHWCVAMWPGEFEQKKRAQP